MSTVLNRSPDVVIPGKLKGIKFDLSDAATRRALELIFFAYPGAVAHAESLNLPKPGTGSTGSKPSYYITEFAKDADGFSYGERVKARKIFDEVRNALMEK